MSDTPGGGGGFPPVPPPQQPPQQPPYGQFPAAPPYPYQAAPVARPATVRNATRAWWAATVCWFLGSVLSQALDGHVSSSFQFTTSRSIQTGNGVLTQTTASPLPLAVSIVAFLIFAGLWALLVYGMYRGANWARIVLAVVGVLGILNLVLQVIAALTAEGLNAGDLLHGLFFLAALGLSIAGYVLMFRADSSPYFTRRR